MDDTTSTVYVTNTNGTAWVELTANGKIELWGADSISMRSEKDFNIRADRDINIESGRHINIKTYHTTQSPPPATDSDQPKSTIDPSHVPHSSKPGPSHTPHSSSSASPLGTPAQSAQLELSPPHTPHLSFSADPPHLP